MNSTFRYIPIYSLMILVSCNVDRWDLEREDIPNYNITISSQMINSNTKSDLVAINDSEFITAIETVDSEIKINRYKQFLENENWEIMQESVLDIGKGRINFFDTIPNGYLIGFTDLNDKFILSIIDDAFNISKETTSLEEYIDTSYNDISSLGFTNFSLDENRNILICGKVITQGVNYSCVLKLNDALEPMWFKTYFENCTISDIAIINQDSFYILNNHPDGTDLIIDNAVGTAYKKYDLSNDQLFFGVQSFVQDESLYIAGIINNIARTIEINLETESAFINEVEIYPVSDFKALYLSRDNIVIAGVQVSGSDQQLFSSELESFGSQWCNRYPNEKFVKILDLIELPERGILISSIVERQGSYHINLTRIDEEGATFNNEYSENCI